MKNNGNDKRTGAYYLGLDVGTNSVGWAVTDKNYNILKFKGNAMWGARLFDEAEDASGRRANRTNRRRLARRHQRLLLLEMLFAKAVNAYANDKEKNLANLSKYAKQLHVYKKVADMMEVLLNG